MEWKLPAQKKAEAIRRVIGTEREAKNHRSMLPPAAKTKANFKERFSSPSRKRGALLKIVESFKENLVVQ